MTDKELDLVINRLREGFYSDKLKNSHFKCSDMKDLSTFYIVNMLFDFIEGTFIPEMSEVFKDENISVSGVEWIQYSNGLIVGFDVDHYITSELKIKKLEDRGKDLCGPDIRFRENKYPDSILFYLDIPRNKSKKLFRTSVQKLFEFIETTLGRKITEDEFWDIDYRWQHEVK